MPNKLVRTTNLSLSIIDRSRQEYKLKSVDFSALEIITKGSLILLDRLEG